MTVDESFKEFYNPGKFKISNREGESINFNEFTIKKLNSIHDVSRIGTFGQLKLSNQMLDKKSRNLLTFEGTDRVRVVKELKQEEYLSIFEDNKNARIAKMQDRLDMLKRFQTSTFNNQDYFDAKEIDVLEKELLVLDKEKVNIDEVQEIFGETNLKIVEYAVIPKQLFTDNNILKEQVKRIWGIFKTLEQQSNLNFTEVPFLDETHQLNLLCAYMMKNKLMENSVMQYLYEIQNPVKKAQIILDLLEDFKNKYVSTWKTHSKGVEKASTAKEAKQQIDELYSYLRKIQEESSSPTKKMVLKKVRESLESKNYPQSIREVIMEELQKFEDLSENFPEFQTIKDFLELVSELPYGKMSQDTYDVESAREILDKDHYGMKKVKDRILEFIAVAKLKNQIKGKNILMVGPPGVGKTSIASSIAKALNREFIRISLGGESDVAILKGHRRTYIGAYPGKLVQALKTAQTENPVILLDEIDKISKGYRGNIQDTLLEILDPQQNNDFRDNFLEAPLDLSKVLFICTANLLETISPPVLDRLEVIELSGYTTEEKMKIAKSHLIPKALDKSGIEIFDIDFTEEGLKSLIQDYARESGVRSLQKKINRICEKICKKIVINPDDDSHQISPQNLKEYLGVKIFGKQRLYGENLPEGISIGLGYNSIGGSILFIETSISTFGSGAGQTDLEKEKGKKGSVKGSITVTGSLGETMKESIQIAYTFSKNICFSKYGNDFLEQNDIHIHFPEGASKKDGPSAGIAITTALISLATGKPICGKLGMTGEISLNGKVLKIGGLREKILAAKREGLNTIIVPSSNKIDVEEIEANLKEGIEFHFISEYDQALPLIFGENLKSSITN